MTFHLQIVLNLTGWLVPLAPIVIPGSKYSNFKQLLDEVFAISRILEVEVGVISRRLRLITLTETKIILDITKTESNNCFIQRAAQKRVNLT